MKLILNAILKKREYPKNSYKCLEVLVGIVPMPFDFSTYNKDIIYNFQELLVCRNAYWKIAGEEMGLDGPWEPDWTKDTEKYVIYPYQYLYSIDVEKYRNTILAFPTREMRDSFYKNFRQLIEKCKNLL